MGFAGNTLKILILCGDSNNSIMKIVALIQARMGSSRFPGKTLVQIKGKPLLYYVLRQVQSAKLIDDVIVATTTKKSDDNIVKLCVELGIKYFRGSEKDVLDRFYQCAKKFKLNVIVRISADSPLIDPFVINSVIQKFLKNDYDYVSNNIDKKEGRWKDSFCNYPIGMVVEIATFQTLKKAWLEAKKPSEREHVFPYVQSHPKKFSITNLKMRKNLSYIRCTVDKKVDLKFVKKILDNISARKKRIVIKDLMKIIKKYPNIIQINNKIDPYEGYKKSLKEDKKWVKKQIK